MPTPIPVLEFEGSWSDMGRALGRACLEQGGRSVTTWFSGLMARLLDGSDEARRRWPRHLQDLTLRAISGLNRRAIDPDLDALLVSFATELGFEARVGPELVYLPDLVHIASGLLGRQYPGPACSAFFARGTVTQGGRILVGRNFDFFGRERWNAHEAALLFRPTGRRAFLWIGALGLPFGHFGINDAGLAVTMFTNFTRDIALTGEPEFSLAHRVLAGAGSLGEAREILRGGRRFAGYSFMVVDSIAREAEVFAFTARHEAHTPLDGDSLQRTNHYVEPRLAPHENAPLAWRRHSMARSSRLVALLAEGAGQLTPADVPRILSDTWDPGERRERVFGDILAATKNAASLTWSPDEDALWTARGRYPVCHAEFWTGLRPMALLRGHAHEAPASLRGSARLDARTRDALESYEEAWAALAERQDALTAIDLLLAAARRLPEEPELPFFAGVLLTQKGRAREALPLLRRSAEAGRVAPSKAAESWIWLSRALDLTAAREEALLAYQRALDVDDGGFGELIRHHLGRPCTLREAGRAHGELSLGAILWPSGPRGARGPDVGP
jgi:hypothetical protein